MRKELLLLDIPEVIETPRLLLKIPRIGMGAELHRAIVDGYEDCVQWLNWNKEIPSIQDVESDCRQHQGEFILRQNIRYVIFDKVTKEIIGRCSLPPFKTAYQLPQFSIAYFIRASRRSCGYATEAAHALAFITFEFLGAKKIEIHCDAGNIASARIPIKLNFKHEYTRKGDWLNSRGELATLATYAIFAKEDLPKMEIQLSFSTS